MKKRKLHRQFAHPSGKNLKVLMKNAEAFDTEVDEIIEHISENCEVCKRFKRTPSRPVVCMPLANKFDQVVAMDLKQFRDGIYFLHLINLFSLFSLSQVITRKLPSVIVDTVNKTWIASGLGAPKKFLIDNGGEFANNLYKEMAADFNVEICNTGAESPWQNGICERNHSVIDLCVEKMVEDDRDLSIEVALAWAVNAKNASSNYSGFSPYQLVLGQNANLPSVLTDDLPALEGKSDQDFVAVHLNPLHAAVKKSGQCRTSSSHGGRENSTEKHQPVSGGISWEPRIVSSHTAPQKIAKKISFQMTENDMMVA